jgi:transposase
MKLKKIWWCLKFVEIDYLCSKKAMKHYHLITCPFCHNDDLVKNGHNPNGGQRWRCNNCKKSFQLEYKYNACQAGVKDTIIQQTLNSSGVRDISRNLKINKNTVVAVLKKNAKNKPLLSYKIRVSNT